MLSAHPTRNGGLVYAKRLGSLGLCFEVVNQPIEKRVHGLSPYGYSPNDRYGYTPLQAYGLPPNNSAMELKDRLKQARKHRKMSQARLSEATGLDQTTISNLETGKVLSTSKLVQIAHALDVDARWLATGKGEMLPLPLPSLITKTNLGGFKSTEKDSQSNVAPAPRLEGYVPIISWVQAGAWSEVCTVAFDTESMVPKPPNSSENTFALRVRGQSMLPKYEPGLIIYVDPEVVPFDGDDVVALMTEENEATFKQLVEEPGGQRLLKARNPAWPDPWVPINGNCEIIGVVVGSLWLRTPRG